MSTNFRSAAGDFIGCRTTVPSERTWLSCPRRMAGHSGFGEGVEGLLRFEGAVGHDLADAVARQVEVEVRVRVMGVGVAREGEPECGVDGLGLEDLEEFA